MKIEIEEALSPGQLAEYCLFAGILKGNTSTPDAVSASDQSAQASGEFRRRLLLRSGAGVIGVATAASTPFLPRGYASLSGGLLKGCRGIGYGRLALDRVEHYCAAHGFSHVSIEVNGSDRVAQRLLLKSGFMATARRLELSLQLTQLSPLKSESSFDFKIVTAAENERPGLANHEVAAALSSMSARSPDFAGLPAWDVQAAEAFLFRSGQIPPQMIHVLLIEEKIEGLCILKPIGERVYCVFTGVSETHHRRRLGVWMKHYALQSASRLGYLHAFTDNLSSNTGALSMNESLGFRQTASRLTFQKRLMKRMESSNHGHSKLGRS